MAIENTLKKKNQKNDGLGLEWASVSDRIKSPFLTKSAGILSWSQDSGEGGDASVLRVQQEEESSRCPTGTTGETSFRWSQIILPGRAPATADWRRTRRTQKRLFWAGDKRQCSEKVAEERFPRPKMQEKAGKAVAKTGVYAEIKNPQTRTKFPVASHCIFTPNRCWERLVFSQFFSSVCREFRGKMSNSRSCLGPSPSESLKEATAAVWESCGGRKTVKKAWKWMKDRGWCVYRVCGLTRWWGRTFGTRNLRWGTFLHGIRGDSRLKD